MKNTRIGIIILNYNGFKDTVACVNSLKKSIDTDFEILLIDNHSVIDEAAKLRKIFSEIECIRTQKNLGFAEGNNVGIRYFLNKDDIHAIMLLNNDTEVSDNLISEMKVEVAGDKKVMVGVSIYAYKDHKRLDSQGVVLYKSFLANSAKEDDLSFAPNGCCALFHRNFFKDIAINNEYLDKDFFCYGEDVDIGIRGRLCGYKSRIVKSAQVFHKGSATAITMSDFSVFYGHRNNVLYVFKSMPLWLLIKKLPYFIVGQIATLVYYLKIRRPTIFMKAKWDSLKFLPRMIKKRKFVMRKRVISTRDLESYLDNKLFHAR
ncbi:glycosyltransferase family 2 protein [Patescibacteria group bacterium]|nr:glycosyltransferase family 2 protein [Patescibacteria group bacterium]